MGKQVASPTGETGSENDREKNAKVISSNLAQPLPYTSSVNKAAFVNRREGANYFPPSLFSVKKVVCTTYVGDFFISFSLPFLSG